MNKQKDKTLEATPEDLKGKRRFTLLLLRLLKYLFKFPPEKFLSNYPDIFAKFSDAGIIGVEKVFDASYTRTMRFIGLQLSGTSYQFEKANSNISMHEVLQFQKYDAVKLIKTIPEKYKKKVEEAIQKHQAGTLPRPLDKEIQRIQKMTDKRAKLIARDQIGKLTAVTTARRYLTAGITRYIWRTAEDERVVGDPVGLYPKATDPQKHGNHYERNGKEFAFDNPPPDGMPGWGILCRCTALPVIPKKSEF